VYTKWTKKCTFLIHQIDTIVQDKMKRISPNYSESSRE